MQNFNKVTVRYQNILYLVWKNKRDLHSNKLFCCLAMNCYSLFYIYLYTIRCKKSNHNVTTDNNYFVQIKIFPWNASTFKSHPILLCARLSSINFTWHHPPLNKSKPANTLLQCQPNAMRTLHNFALLTLLVSLAFGQNCSQEDAFKNLKVLKFSGGSNDGEIKVSSSEDLRDAYRIEVLHQNLEKLCEGAVRNFPELDKLVLQDDGIKEVQGGAFQDLPVLRDLRITYNEIGTIKKGVFNGLKVNK